MPPLRVAMPCTGLGRQARGFEAFTREARAALRHAEGLDLRVYGGGGDLRDGERAVWNLPRAHRPARCIGNLTHRDPYFIEQASFFAAFLPRLLQWQPHVVYFADLNFGNACWHWRRWSGQSFRLLYYNGGRTTRPFTRCDAIQQVTPAHFASAVERGEPPDRMLVLPHGLAIDTAVPTRDPVRIAATRRALKVPDGRAMLLSVGMLDCTTKRMDVLIDAVASLTEPRPHLVMLGQETPETPALRERSRILGDGVTFDTWPRDRMTDAYLAADAFALLSLDEGFGLAYVEAMAAGVPCVAQKNANTQYILGELALLGDTTTPAGAASLVQQALQESGGEAMRRARHARMRERFSWDVLAPRYVEMLRACAEGRPLAENPS